jgi:uncharacterized protein YbjT (DUF2867 family)
MNLVVGSTGLLGREICRQLLKQGKPVRALVRDSSDPTRVDALRTMGAQIVIGDLRDKPTLARACVGVDCVHSTATATSAFSAENTFLSADGGTRDLIDAAKANGVSQFVFVSLSSGLNPNCDLSAMKRAIEYHLIQSGVSYTILRPCAFMELWFSPMLGFDVANARAQVIGEGNARLSYISYTDVAQFCVATLGNPNARDVALDIGGPDSVSAIEVVNIFEKITGKRFAVTHIPLEALQAQHIAAVNPLEKTFAALMLEVGKGDVVPMNDVLRRFPQVKLKSVEEFARQTVPVAAV